jgi:hypothetical protein
MVAKRWLVAGAATAFCACIEPMEPDDEGPGDPIARFSPDECTVVNPGPFVDDGLVGICHACDDGYEYVRVSPESCRNGHARHAHDFRSDDPLCRLLPRPLVGDEPLLDTVH